MAVLILLLNLCQIISYYRALVANEIFNNLIELSEDCFDSIVKHGGGQGGYFCILKWDSRIYVAAENKGLY